MNQHIRNHPAYIALQNRLDIQHDINAALQWPEGTITRLEAHQFTLESADYLQHLPVSAFFVYSSPKCSVLVIHCALPLISTETRYLREIATVLNTLPTFTVTKEVLLLVNDNFTIYWQSAPGRVLPPL